MLGKSISGVIIVAFAVVLMYFPDVTAANAAGGDIKVIVDKVPITALDIYVVRPS